MSPRRAISPDWSEGEYLDRWMLVHFASGVTGGLSNVIFALTVPRVYAVAIAVMVAYEAAEYLLGIRESLPNILIDVGIGLVGVTVALGIARLLDERGERIAFVLAFAAALTGSVLGWIDYRRRSREEQKGPATKR